MSLMEESTDMEVAYSSSGSLQEVEDNATVVEQPIGKRIFKIIVIGDSNVGKTCLTFRFCSGRFPEKTEATIGVDFREKWVDVGDDKIKLQIWDTAGQERFRRSMVQHYYRNVHAVMFVYDVTRLSSFESLPSWINECESYGLGTGVPRILVGNKCDLTSSSDSSTVSTSLAQRFADMHDMPLFETSAKDNSQSDHVESIFLTLAHKLKNSKPMMIQQPAAKPLVLSSSTHQQSTDTSTGCWC